jgi:malate dehydrogenase (oxaloacetate-decarboxylating)(NADP+)
MDQKDTDRQAAFDYHEFPTPGKTAVMATKPLVTQRDLALAYTPGVAAVCEEIAADPHLAHRFTGRGNLVGVITNGTAVLGLGNIGALASKPVMEGKAVLFKKFAGIDVFDIEISETDPDKLVDIIASLEATFGGINLEDIKAPECFAVERQLRERMKIHHRIRCFYQRAEGGGQIHFGSEGGDVGRRCSGTGMSRTTG